MLNLIGLELCGFPLPTISFIIFHDFGRFVLLSSNCSSMYSVSLFLRGEVNLLLNVVHSSLLSLEGFFFICMLENMFGFNRLSQCCSEIW